MSSRVGFPDQPLRREIGSSYLSYSVSWLSWFTEEKRAQRDLHRIKTKAAEEGVPYQTLISSLIHKYAAKG